METSIVIMSTTGEERRELLRLEMPEFVNQMTGLAFTADGQYLLFGKGVGSFGEATWELWRIAVGGGVPEQIEGGRIGMRDLSVHPDGTRIAFTGGQWSSLEVWVMNHFLPE